jgi:integrase
MSRFLSRLHQMKARATNRNDSATLEPPTTAPTKAPSYEKVLDGRKQPVRGLWRRGGTFYARFTATDQAGRKRDVFRALPDCQTVPTAKAALRKLQDEAAVRSVPVAGRCPTFAEFGTRYLAEVSPTKRLATQRKERTHVEWWTERVGSLTLKQLHRTHVHTAIADLTKAGLSPRTCNLYVITFRSVLKRAVEEGLIHELPTHGLRPQKVSNRKRELLPLACFLKVLAAAEGATKNSAQFADYFRFLLFTGAREKEALRIRWSDVDFTNAQVAIGADGLAKNHEVRRVDFNPELDRLLRAMHARRAPDSQWLFPSPQRGNQDIPAKTFRESLRLACKAAQVELFGFHDARHYFISQCVMAGIDFMSIAAWVGHKDGGVLIGKVYGHLADEHRKRQAQRLSFQPEVEANQIRLPTQEAVA